MSVGPVQVKSHQENMRAILPKALIEALEKGVPEGHTLGRVFLATKNWKGSRRHMQQAYADARAIFSHLGRPHLFFTWTGNPKWPEIQDTLLPGQSFINQPLAVTRIFWEKLEQLQYDITKRCVLHR